MTNHTGHNHPATPAARRACRNLRNAKVREAQKAFSAAALDNDSALISEYEALVDSFAMTYGMDLNAAYDLIENGPIVH